MEVYHKISTASNLVGTIIGDKSLPPLLADPSSSEPSLQSFSPSQTQSIGTHSLKKGTVSTCYNEIAS